MIQVLLEENAWCYWVVSVGALLSFLGLVVACICSCRRNENKSEFLGLPGMVTLNHSENEGFNTLPSLEVSQVLVQDTTDNGKRTSGANRSLPDIPKDKSRGEATTVSVSQDIYETSEINSELYATVQDTDEQQPEKEIQGLPQQVSLAQDNSAYQLSRFTSSISKNDEHPYAQLQGIQKPETEQPHRNSTNQVVTIDKPSTSTSHVAGNPVAPPRTRKSSSYNSLLSAENQSDIQAANAISGGVQANQDLPYMTPPLVMLLPHPPQLQHNTSQYFSGDSQDSKGYTSISVREPLANILAQTKASYQQHQPTRLPVDPHYATVSDDSDEMYAAIDEQEKIYTSGSETYAQIQPTILETHRIAHIDQSAFNQPSLRSEEIHTAPQPPSVDSLRHVAHAHSRQASSSSATSSIINPGSPKPEKRQANSPLPPPPEAISDTYAAVDKRAKNDERLRSNLSTGKSLEDMYAKVMKKKKDADEQNDASLCSNILHSEATPSSRKLSLIEISRASWSSHDSVEIQKEEHDAIHYTIPPSTVINIHTEMESNCLKLSRISDGDAANLLNQEINHGYESVNSKRNLAARSFPTCDPNYEMSHIQCLRNSDYQSTSTSVRNAPDLLLTYPSSYKHRQVSNASSEDPGYEKVRLRRQIDLDQDTDSEPNYESMPHDAGEPNYASVCRPGDSDTDPNYESVSHGDPNYESVKYLSVAVSEEPPYEQVNNYKPETNVDGYEKIKGNGIFNSDYEKINPSNVLEQCSNGDTDDEQYVQHEAFAGEVSESIFICVKYMALGSKAANLVLFVFSVTPLCADV